MPRLLGLVLPLCLDTFAVAAALGVGGLSARQRVRVGLLFAAFEGGMPLLGLLFGVAAGAALGGLADYAAVAAVGLVGGYLLRPGADGEEARARRLLKAGGAAVIALGVSISLDELAIGFALGLVRVSVVEAVVLIVVQAFLVTQLGLALGRRVGARLREGAERAAGLVLLLLALLLLVSKLARFPL